MDNASIHKKKKHQEIFVFLEYFFQRTLCAILKSHRKYIWDHEV